MNRQIRFAVLSFIATQLGHSAAADAPRGILAVDDAGDRVLWLSAATGDLIREIVPSNATELSAPFAAVPGPSMVSGDETHPQTILVGDIRRRRIAAFDEITGQFLREWVGNIDVHALIATADGTWLVAAGSGGVRSAASDGTLTNRIAPEAVLGPNNAWGVVLRPATDKRPAEYLVTDPTLDAVFRFDATGARLGVFCRHADFRFPQQIALRGNGRILVVDPLANRVFEFDENGGDVRMMACPHPRGAIELGDSNLLIASDDGLQVFDGDNGTLLETKLPGLPTNAFRMLTPVPCDISPGDLNGDGRVNSFDIDAFVLALTDETAFAAQYPGVDRICAGDINRDSRMNSFDIDPFVALLVGG